MRLVPQSAPYIRKNVSVKRIMKHLVDSKEISRKGGKQRVTGLSKIPKYQNLTMIL